MKYKVIKRADFISNDFSKLDFKNVTIVKYLHTDNTIIYGIKINKEYYTDKNITNLLFKNIDKMYNKNVKTSMIIKLKDYTKTPVIHYCNDIGMYSIDKALETCIFKTKFCKLNCYNCKLFKMFDNMKLINQALINNWKNFNSETLKNMLGKKYTTISYFRYCTRGESINNVEDIMKIKDIAEKNPEIKFWIPTRAWRTSILRDKIVQELFPVNNIYVLASIDPSNTKKDYDNLVGWRKMFFGDNNLKDWFSTKMYHCPKTFNHLNNVCTTCKMGCFNRTTEIIHLKQH